MLPEVVATEFRWSANLQIIAACISGEFTTLILVSRLFLTWLRGMRLSDLMESRHLLVHLGNTIVHLSPARTMLPQVSAFMSFFIVFLPMRYAGQWNRAVLTFPCLLWCENIAQSTHLSYSRKTKIDTIRQRQRNKFTNYCVTPMAWLWNWNWL